MASTAPNWSVVGKTKKGSKGPAPTLTKSQKKNFVDNMPRIEKLDPVKEDSTIYEAFMAKEQQRYERRQQEKFADKIEAGKEPNGKGISDGGQKKKSMVQKNKKPDQDRRKKPFDEALKGVTDEDLKSVLMQSKGHFPDKPELWLKDLVTFMNMKLEVSAETDLYLKPENKDFPLSSVKKSCVKVFHSVLNQKDCTMATLEHVLYFCVNNMLEENQCGNSTYGYKIFIQILARQKPDTFVSKLSQYRDIVKSTQNRPDRCLSVLWAMGQVGMTSLRSGLRVWLELMVPCLGYKSLAGFCVTYLENLLKMHSSEIGTAYGEITLKEYFNLLDLMYGTSLQNDFRKRLVKVYPQLKMIAHGDSPSSNLRNFFPWYLERVGTGSTATLKAEVLNCLLDCLSKDKQCYSRWCEIYLRQLTESRILMDELLQRWGSISGGINYEPLKQTMMTFVRTNEEEATKGRISGDWVTLTTTCEEVLKRLARPRFPWKWLMFFLITTVIGIVAYDVYSSKKLENSRTVGFLQTYGVLGFLQNIWSGLCMYSAIVIGWLQVNVPVYYATVRDTVSPYVAKFVDFCMNMEEYTRDTRRNVADKVYSMAPDFWTEAGRLLWLCWDFILEYSYWIQGHIAVLYKAVCLWVDTNIINGDFSSRNIQDTLSWSANKVQNMTLSAVIWCKQLWT